MGISRPPLRVAFWAISAALLLMLLATLSDPYRVRQSLLARHRPDVEPGTDATLVVRGEPADVSDRQLPSLTTSEDSASRLAADVTTAPEAVAALPTETDRHEHSLDRGIQTHVVSTGRENGRRNFSRPVEHRAMPILSPGELTGPTTGGRFEELPPPPEMQPQEEFLQESSPGSEGTPALTDNENLALQRLQLETELLTLRHDLTQSIESQQIERLQHLQQQQFTLLERQQQTAERLEELASQLNAQSDRLDRLIEQQASPPAQTPPTDEAADGLEVLTSGPHLAPTAGGRQRLSLVIESDDVAGILERLGRWSSESALPASPPPLTHSSVEAESRYLAPPPGHADPTPLSSPHSLPAVMSGEPVIGGPQFIPRSLCR